jgi:ribosome-associated protein
MQRVDDENYKSKSQIKREAQAMDDLGKELAGLSEKQLLKMQLAEPLKTAVMAVQTMQKEAMRRQLQYIGKLLRKMDVSPIQAELDRIQNRSNIANAHFQKLEKHRDKLIAGDETLFELILKEHPHANRQQLRQLVRNAQKELAQEKTTGAAKALFRYLREIDEAEDQDEGDNN